MPHGMHHASPGVVWISSRAPSARLARVTTSKQKRSASGSTCDSAPISSRISRHARPHHCLVPLARRSPACSRPAPFHAWPTSIAHATHGSSACTASRALLFESVAIVSDQAAQPANECALGMEIPLGRRDDLVVCNAAVGEAHPMQTAARARSARRKVLRRAQVPLPGPMTSRARPMAKSASACNSVASSASRATMRVATLLPSRAASAATSGCDRIRASAPVSTGAPTHVGARENSGCCASAGTIACMSASRAGKGISATSLQPSCGIVSRSRPSNRRRRRRAARPPRPARASASSSASQSVGDMP